MYAPVTRILSAAVSFVCLIAPGIALGQEVEPRSTSPREEAPPIAVPITRRPQERARQAAVEIERILDESTTVNSIEMELGQVLRDIAKEHNLQITLDPLGFQIAGTTTDQLITIELRQVSLRSALKTILRPLQLTFVVRDEVLMITSLDCPERLATVRTFPLGDLLARVDDPTEILAALEMVWPSEHPRDRETDCQPRASIVAGHLVVRGSPRHHELAAELIENLMTDEPANGRSNGP